MTWSLPFNRNMCIFFMQISSLNQSARSIKVLLQAFLSINWPLGWLTEVIFFPRCALIGCKLQSFILFLTAEMVVEKHFSRWWMLRMVARAALRNDIHTKRDQLPDRNHLPHCTSTRLKWSCTPDPLSWHISQTGIQAKHILLLAQSPALAINLQNFLPSSD